MIDPDDLRALDARIAQAVTDRMDVVVRQSVAAAKRAKHEAFAAALRMQAAEARAEGDLKLARAHELDEFAAAIERGEAEPPPALRRVRIVLDETDAPPAPDDEGEEKAALIEQLVEGADVSPHMREFLDRFSSRFLSSPFFPEVLSRFEHHVANDETANLIAQTVRELEEQAAKATTNETES